MKALLLLSLLLVLCYVHQSRGDNLVKDVSSLVKRLHNDRFKYDGQIYEPNCKPYMTNVRKGQHYPIFEDCMKYIAITEDLGQQLLNCPAGTYFKVSVRKCITGKRPDDCYKSEGRCSTARRYNATELAESAKENETTEMNTIKPPIAKVYRTELGSVTLIHYLGRFYTEMCNLISQPYKEGEVMPSLRSCRELFIADKNGRPKKHYCKKNYALDYDTKRCEKNAFCVEYPEMCLKIKGV